MSLLLRRPRPSLCVVPQFVVSVLIVGLSYGARNVLSHTRCMMENFLAFRDCPIIPLRHSPPITTAAAAASLVKRERIPAANHATAPLAINRQAVIQKHQKFGEGVSLGAHCALMCARTKCAVCMVDIPILQTTSPKF